MNYIDIIFLIAIIIGAVQGFSRGVLLELTALVSIALGIYGAVHFSSLVENYIKQHFHYQTDYLGIIAFALTFFGVVVCVTIIGKILTKIVSVVGLGLVNKVLGSVFGGVKFIVILGAFMLYFLKINSNIRMVTQDQIDESIAVKFIKEFEPDVLHQFEKTKEQANKFL